MYISNRNATEHTELYQRIFNFTITTEQVIYYVHCTVLAQLQTKVSFSLKF